MELGEGSSGTSEIDLQNIYQNNLRNIKFSVQSNEPILCKACGLNKWHNRIKRQSKCDIIYCMCGNKQRIYAEGIVEAKK